MALESCFWEQSEHEHFWEPGPEGLPKEDQATLLFSKPNDARVEPAEHLFPTSLIVKMSEFYYIYYCSSFRFNLSYMTLHLESLPLSII